MIQKAFETFTAWLGSRKVRRTSPLQHQQWNRYPIAAQRLANDALRGKGKSTPALRQAVANAASLNSTNRATEAVPETLQAYIHKVAHSAYKVTDTDVHKLKQAGYGEDEIFELTISAALGASFTRLESGLTALENARQNGAI